MTLTMERIGGENGADFGRQRRIRRRPHWPASCRRSIGPRGLMAINAGTSEPPDPAN